MPPPRRTTEQLKRAFELVEEHGGVVADAARAAGVPTETFRHTYNDAKRRRHEWDIISREARAESGYEAERKVWDAAIGKVKDRYKGPCARESSDERKRFVVFGDPHCPFQETEFIEEIIRREKGADVAVVMGDSIDGYSVSRYVAYERVPIESEYSAMEIFYGRLSESFPRVKRIRGNHDDRVEKNIRDRLSMDAVQALLIMTGGHFDLVTKATMDMPNVEGIGHRAHGKQLGWLAQIGDAIFSHAEKFSITPGAALRKVEEWLSDNERIIGLEPWSVVFQAHTHQLGMFPWHASKWLIEVGCLCKTPGYALTARIGGRPQRRGYVTFEQVNGVTDTNTIRIYSFDGQDFTTRASS